MDKCLIAMSGGVDSAVAALMVKEMNMECIGATMKLLGGGGKASEIDRGEKRLVFGYIHRLSSFRAKVLLLLSDIAFSVKKLCNKNGTVCGTS